MTIKIHSIRFDADKELEDFVGRKINKLNLFYDDIISAEVFLRIVNSQNLENKVTEIKLEIRGNDLFAKKQSRTFEEAADMAVEALRRQLKKYKEKQRGK